MKNGVGTVATTIPKTSKNGGEMVKKASDPVDVRELLAWVYADLQRLAREAQEKRAGGDEDAEISPDDRAEEA